VNQTPKSLVLLLLSYVDDVDLRNTVHSVKNDLDVEKKRNHELADLLHEKTKQCSKVQVLHVREYIDLDIIR